MQNNHVDVHINNQTSTCNQQWRARFVEIIEPDRKKATAWFVLTIWRVIKTTIKQTSAIYNQKWNLSRQDYQTVRPQRFLFLPFGSTKDSYNSEQKKNLSQWGTKQATWILLPLDLLSLEFAAGVCCWSLLLEFAAGVCCCQSLKTEICWVYISKQKARAWFVLTIWRVIKTSIKQASAIYNQNELCWDRTMKQ